MGTQVESMVVSIGNSCVTDNGHPERAFFSKIQSFGLGQANWAEILRLL